MKKTKMTKAEFIKKHAELKRIFKEVKRALRHVHVLTKPLVKQASRLHKQGYSMQLDMDMGAMPAFSSFPKMMSDLDFWRTLDTDLTF